LRRLIVGRRTLRIIIVETVFGRVRYLLLIPSLSGLVRSLIGSDLSNSMQNGENTLGVGRRSSFQCLSQWRVGESQKREISPHEIPMESCIYRHAGVSGGTVPETVPFVFPGIPCPS
jgi:hypothetical protein